MTNFKERVFYKLLDDIHDVCMIDRTFHEIKKGIVTNIEKIEVSKNPEDVKEYLYSLKGILWSYGLETEGDEVAILEQRVENGENVLVDIQAYGKELKKFVA
ncbi:MAG: hypothetical protein OIF32_01960 [Campylobacterales bacterium]|nr:hypothetical protein [Campylobacterales bacterium]